MSTRCLVGILHRDGRVTYIYVHFDGYIEGVGAVLLKFYVTEQQVMELMATGNCSSLDEVTGRAKNPYYPHEPCQTVHNESAFYEVDPVFHEFFYLFRGEEQGWTVRTNEANVAAHPLQAEVANSAAAGTISTI
jgi:hypothetical protein